MRFYFLTFLIIALGFPTMAQAAMTDYPEVRIRALDKSTARTKTMQVKVGDTVEFGSLFIKPQACRKSDPLSKPENASFVQVWEIPLGKTKSEWIFSGWMFSSSPAVSAMDHAVYDVWVLECIDPNKKPIERANRIVVTTDDGEETIDDLDAFTGIEEEIEDFEAEMLEEIEPNEAIEIYTDDTQEIIEEVSPIQSLEILE